jgi:hypothetical protein
MEKVQWSLRTPQAISMVKTVILHIGYPKTGTTSIQWCLNENRDKLRELGIQYPESGQFHDHSHNRLAFALFDNLHEHFSDTQRTALFDQLGDELAASPCETAVLSSELFVGRLEQMRASQHFMDVFRGSKVRAVCYLRRQDSFLESLYTLSVWSPKRRLSLDVDAFLRSEHLSLGDYYPVVSGWAEFLGGDNFIPVIYEQAHSNGGCVRKFFECLNIAPDSLADLDIRVNAAISGPLGTQIMRIVNTYTELSDEQRLDLATRVKQLDAAVETLPVPNRLFSPEQRLEIGRRFLESNEKLAQEFIHQPLDGFWFPDLPN